MRERERERERETDQPTDRQANRQTANQQMQKIKREYIYSYYMFEFSDLL